VKLILTQDVKKLGKKGDVLEVADGYGRNFLLPKGLALEASKTNLSALAQENTRIQTRINKELAEAKATGEKLEQAEITVFAKAGEGGRLFGSVTNKEIAEQILKQFNIEVDRRKVELPETIKSLGDYSVLIKLHPEVHVKIKINVVSQ